MPKVKNHIIREKKDYLYVAVDIGICIFCILLIGRVGVAGKTLALFLSFIFGDFSTILLAFAMVYSVVYLLFKKKIDFHHISFIGTIFIIMALLMFAHLGVFCMDERLDKIDKLDYEHILMVKAVWYYYIESYTQQNISKLLGVSRSKVISLLERARQTGVIQFNVRQESSRRMQVEQDMIYFTDTAETPGVYATSAFNDPELVNRLWESGCRFAEVKPRERTLFSVSC